MKKELRAELPEALRAEARAALLLRLVPGAPRGAPLEVPLGIFLKKNFGAQDARKRVLGYSLSHSEC